MKGRKQSQKAIDAIRKTGFSLRGKKSSFYGKCRHGQGVWYDQRPGVKVFLRSSYELAYVKYLDASNIPWEYEPKVFPISYEYNGRMNEGTYRPDFYLPNAKVWIEVKGWWRGDAHAKFHAFIEQYPQHTIQIIGEQQLKQLGCI